jgi:butyrate kinase
VDPKGSAWPGGNLLRKCVLCLLLALAAPIAAQGGSSPKPIPADGKCAIPVDPSWTKQEQFVWLNVCVGKAADFNKEPGYGGDLDPKSPSGLPEGRILRSSFLETILLNDKYRSALTRLGVRITGARFTETVDLRNAELEHDLRLDRSLLEKGANLISAKTSRQISFDGSKILGAFSAAEAQIDEDLSMNRAEFSSEVNFSRAHIGNGLILSGSTVTGALNMNEIHVDQSLFMRDKAQFNAIDLIGAYVGGDFILGSSTVKGALNMNKIHIGQSLFMNDKAQFTEVNLGSAHVGGDVILLSSTVTGMLNMSGFLVDKSVFMRDKAQFKDVNLGTAHIAENLELDSSTVTGMLGMNAIRVDQNLFLRDKAQFAEINLVAAHIGGNFDLSSATVMGMLNMNGIRVDQSLFMRVKAQFKDINLGSAHIGGPLNLNSSAATGILDMRGSRFDQDLLMSDKAQFKEINLTAAHIGGGLDLSSSTVTGKLKGKYLDVEGAVSLGSGATFKDEIDLTSAKLGQDLELSTSAFNQKVDLSGTQVSGFIGLQSTKWLGDATLNLNDAAVGGIDLSHSWPDKIHLNGLTYHNLSNLAENFNREQAETWFGKQRYTPQPYEQLASVLQANGLIADATAIRYAGREQEQKTTPHGLYKAWLVLLHYSIGFGYHLEFAFYWAVAFVLLGWAVLYATGQRTKHGITLGLTYSFDMLLPLVQLRKKNYDIDLDPWPQRYFYAHKIIGVVLTSFIVAGISGLTK